MLVSRLGDLRAENDATCTFEGENNVLIQQASNWLLNQWSNVLSGKLINCPLGTADFMKDANNTLIHTFSYSTIDETIKAESMKINLNTIHDSRFYLMSIFYRYIFILFVVIMLLCKKNI